MKISVTKEDKISVINFFSFANSLMIAFKNECMKWPEIQLINTYRVIS